MNAFEEDRQKREFKLSGLIVLVGVSVSWISDDGMVAFIFPFVGLLIFIILRILFYVTFSPKTFLQIRRSEEFLRGSYIENAVYEWKVVMLTIVYSGVLEIITGRWWVFALTPVLCLIAILIVRFVK